MKNILIVLCILGGLGKSVNAQVDPHFSQYYVYPSWLNPALTGAFDGDFRVSGIYRSQWGNIANGFSTSGLSADAVTGKNLNVGVSILQQHAGTGGYTYTTGYASLAYTGLRFDKAGYKRVAIGMQIGFISRKFNPAKFELGDQWNPITGYNPGTATADVLTKNSSSVFDAGAGIVYYDATPNKAANVFIGFSGSHLTKPEDAFSAGPLKQTIPTRYTAHGGVKLALSETVSITPNLLYLKQGDAEEKMAGAYAQLKASDDLNVLVGINYRFNDAVVPFAGLDYKNLLLGVSYDANTSDLGKSITTTSSFELSLTYIFKKSHLLNEKFFTCPRL